jgi:hypothetical protein
MRYTIFIFLMLSITLHSQSGYSIKKTLDSTTFKYFVDGDGDFIVDYTTRTGRDQHVIIRNNINSFQSVEIREVLSIAQIFNDKSVPENLTNYLLIDNYSSKYLGNWAIHKKDSISTIIFIVKLPYNSDKYFIEAAITEAAEAADALEKALEDEIENNSN